MPQPLHKIIRQSIKQRLPLIALCLFITLACCGLLFYHYTHSNNKNDLITRFGKSILVVSLNTQGAHHIRGLAPVQATTS